ncbi:MAG: VOC family protein [Acidobacteriota bacterium]
MATKKATKKKAAKKATAKRPVAKAKAPARKAKAPKPVKAKARPKPAATAAKTAAPSGQTMAQTRAERRRSFPEALRLRDFSVAMTVDDLQRSINHYVDGLGFTIKDRWERDGKLLGVMLVAGACEIGLSQDDWAKGRNRAKGIGVSFFAETGQSLDLIAALATERGIAVEGPKLAPWGDRVVEIKDPDGYKLTIYWPK